MGDMDFKMTGTKKGITALQVSYGVVFSFMYQAVIYDFRLQVYIKNRLKLFNNTHIFDPYISVIPITVLSGWKLNCD